MHDGFDFWVADLDDADGSDGGRARAGQRGRRADRPGSTAVEAAYWTSVGNREYLRWVLPEDEDRAARRLRPAARRPTRSTWSTEPG